MADPLGLIASGAIIPYVGSTGIRVVDSLTGALTTTVQNTGSLAILEVASPVGSNAPPQENIFGANPFHMFFFDQACLRQGPSVGNPLTTNDADLINLNLIGMGTTSSTIPGAGLIAAASVDNSAGVKDTLVNMTNPIHARVYWINAIDGVLSRILEPISARHAELGALLDAPGVPASLLGAADWNPLRTGATFVAPFEGSGVRSTLYFVCPTQNIIPGVFPEIGAVAPFFTTTNAQISPATGTIPTASNGAVPFASSGVADLCAGVTATNCTDAFSYTGTTTSSFTGVTGIGGIYPSGRAISPVPIDPAATFPHLNPVPVPGTTATPLFLRVYDDEENFRRNIDIFCRCWGAHPVVNIDPVFSNPDPVSGAPRGTYTEVEGEPACTKGGAPSECSFTGYRTIQWGQGVVGNDIFGRLSNGSFVSLRGVQTPNQATVPVDSRR
jgi:hypothetical protein